MHEFTLKLHYPSAELHIPEGSNPRAYWPGVNMVRWTSVKYCHHVAGVCWGHSLGVHGCQCHQQHCGAEFGYAGRCSRGLAGHNEWYSGQRLHIWARRNFKNGNVWYTIARNLYRAQEFTWVVFNLIVYNIAITQMPWKEIPWMLVMTELKACPLLHSFSSPLAYVSQQRVLSIVHGYHYRHLCQ